MKKIFLFAAATWLFAQSGYTQYANRFTIPKAHFGAIPPSRNDPTYQANTLTVATLPTTGNGPKSSQSQSLIATTLIVANDETDVRPNASSTEHQTEIHISINKTNPNNLLLSFNNDVDNWPVHIYASQGYYYSLNGGLTWNGLDWFPNDVFNNPTYARGDPTTAFDAGGNGFLGTLGPDQLGGPPYGLNQTVYFSSLKTTDGGVTWQPQVNTPYNFNAWDDKDMMTADDVSTSSYANNIYAVWSELTSPGRVMFNRSTDGGLTFQAADLYLGNSLPGYGVNVQAGPSGEVYVAWCTDYSTFNGIPNVPAHKIEFTSSLNGGQTFSTPNLVTTINGIGASGANFGFTKTIDYVSMAVDKSCDVHRGRIYITYSDYVTANKSRIKVKYSDDQGATWNDCNGNGIVDVEATDAVATGQNYMPWIAVDDATGLVCVAYYCYDDILNPLACSQYIDGNPIFCTNIYLAYSGDGGLTWDNIKVSDVPHPEQGIYQQGGYRGEYFGVTAYGGNAYVAWMDNRLPLPAPVNHLWQVYVSRINFQNVPVLYSSATDININGPITINANQFITYQAVNSITVPVSSTYTVSPGADVTMRAGVQITLKDGFHASHNYHAYITPVSPCTTPTTYRLTQESNVESDNEGSEMDFVAFPNPSSGKFFLQTNNKSKTAKFIIIEDLLGKLVWQSQNNFNELISIDISSFPKGYYNVRIVQEENFKAKKILIM